MPRGPAERPYRRVALVLGLFGLFEGGDALLGVLAKRFPAIQRLRALQQKG